MKKLLVTGAAGFLAHHLIAEAQKGKWYVIGVDKRPIQKGHNKPDHFIQTNVFDVGFRDLMGVDAVVHFAWRTNIPDCARHPKPSTYENIDMTVHMLDVCKDAGIKRFIFPSTASLYSHNPTPWTEDMMPEPIEPYSWQKLACEQLCKMYSTQYEVPTVVLRFFQIFGEYQRDDTALAAFLRLKASGKPITLTKTTAQSSFKSGQRDFIYAGDVVKAVLLAIKSKNVGKGEIINIACGKTNTMEEIAKAMKAKIEWIPRRPWEVERHHADIKKARVLLGFEPKTDVIKWIDETMQNV